MTEVEQQPAIKKRTRLALRLVIYALLVGIAAAFFFGMNTIGQWDLSTGRSRTVTTLLGIPITYGKPESTRLSNWLGDTIGEEKWITVRGPAPRSRAVKVSWCSSKLLNVLRRMEFELGIAEDEGWFRGDEGRRFVATEIVQSLAGGKPICDVYSQVGKFEEKLNTVVSSWSPFTTNTLAALWEETENP